MPVNSLPPGYWYLRPFSLGWAVEKRRAPCGGWPSCNLIQKVLPPRNLYLFLIDFYLITCIGQARQNPLDLCSILKMNDSENVCSSSFILHLGPGPCFIGNLYPLERETNLHRSYYVQQLPI